MSLVGELKRKNVVRVGFAYAVIGHVDLFIEGIDTYGPSTTYWSDHDRISCP